MTQSGTERDAGKKEWKPDPSLTMEIRKGADWKSDDSLTMTLKASKKTKKE
ncbi:MAG: hypothetical protein NWE96_04555 [Candidatus Bathyarchaeota archaeon]|nr:hypothetical protein [Candidatus Bathyarchaeota archaeon]